MPVLPNLNSIKVGLVILYGGEPYIVQTSNFVRMQQRKPVMQTKLKHLITNATLEYSFKPGDKVETADLDRSRATFLYNDHEGAHFMDSASYEQLTFGEDIIADVKKFFKEGLEVQILNFNGKAIGIELPPKAEYMVTDAPDGAKGDSAQGRVMKEVTLENGMMLRTPLFVKEGDIVRVSTETGDYVERVEQKK